MKLEIKLIVVAIIIALLNIVAHLLMTKHFQGMPWVEMSLASVPLAMALLCWGAIRAAKQAWQQENQQAEKQRGE